LLFIIFVSIYIFIADIDDESFNLITEAIKDYKNLKVLHMNLCKFSYYLTSLLISIFTVYKKRKLLIRIKIFKIVKR